VCGIDNDIPKCIKGDVVRLHLVLNNLLHNAFKFTERGRVDLKLTRRVSVAGQSQLLFVVQDTGIGISSELLPSLFEPFTQSMKARRDSVVEQVWGCRFVAGWST